VESAQKRSRPNIISKDLPSKKICLACLLQFIFLYNNKSINSTMASLIKLLFNKDWEAADSRIRDSPQDLKIQYPMDAPLNATALEAAIQSGA
jgi:hypothetical protein